MHCTLNSLYMQTPIDVDGSVYLDPEQQLIFLEMCVYPYFLSCMQAYVNELLSALKTFHHPY